MTEPDEQQLNPAQSDVQDSTICLNSIQETVIIDDAQPANMENDGAGQDNAEHENAMEVDEEQNNAQQIVVAVDEEKGTQDEGREIDAAEPNDGAETEENSDSMYLSQEAPISEQLTAFQNTPDSSPCSPSPQHQDTTLHFPKDPTAADMQSQEEKPDPDPNPASEDELNPRPRMSPSSTPPSTSTPLSPPLPPVAV